MSLVLSFNPFRYGVEHLVTIVALCPLDIKQFVIFFISSNTGIQKYINTYIIIIIDDHQCLNFFLLIKMPNSENKINLNWMFILRSILKYWLIILFQLLTHD